MDDTKTAVLNIIQAYCQDRLATASTISPEYAALWQQLSDYVAGGGKRIRPYLVDLSYRAYGGTDRPGVLPVAAAWELLHACLLIHDDIIDQDYVRHGKPNVAGHYRARFNDDQQLGDSMALIAGDIALSGSYQLILQSSLPLPLLKTTLLRFGAVIDTVAGGQMMDAIAPVLPKDQVDVSKINYAKTAVYTFIGPLCSGAELAGADKKNLELLNHLGVELGAGFQLADDLLGVFGDTAETGKSNESDLAAGKQTRLFIETYARVDHERVDQAVAAKDIEGLRTMMVESGAKTEIERLIAGHAAAAELLVEQLAWPATERAELSALVTKALFRTV